jgi:hypothetical protein
MLTYIFVSVYLRIVPDGDEKRCFPGHSRSEQKVNFEYARQREA